MTGCLLVGILIAQICFLDIEKRSSIAFDKRGILCVDLSKLVPSYLNDIALILFFTLSAGIAGFFLLPR